MLGLPQGEVFLVPWTEEWEHAFLSEKARIEGEIGSRINNIHRHYFNKGEPRTHQVHVYQTGSPYLLRQLAFRDHLNQHIEARNNYGQLKEVLALAHHKDKLAYADAKTEFINVILEYLNYRRLT